MKTLFLAAVAATSIAAAPPPQSAGTICEAQWRDAARNRIVPVRIRMPAGTGKVPVILFSHGLGGSLDAGTFWAEAWVRDGDAVIHLQHAGSDSGIIGTGGIRAAMSIEQMRARADDVHFTIDELAKRRREGGCDLTRLDLSWIGMSGHSFGAQTTLSIAGQHYPMAGLNFADSRVKAAIAFSPQPPVTASDASAFGGITMPFFSITGTRDEVAWLNKVTPKDRERPFRAMAPGGKYLLVMEGANHRMFSGQDNIPLPGSTPLPHVREVVARATTLFWRWTLRGDMAAKAELDRLGATLPPGDRFEKR
ncbi:MAG: dienelactone hydrolase [Sphingomonas sp.]|jgi:predicted dienelactone hydrolase|uniref:alpha/beta hydrolase family protein n=1 Tax=Sphingomonas sp. TaxID=28214 RepID=UPI003568872B